MTQKCQQSSPLLHPWREFQSLMVQGKKEPPQYCVLVVMRLSCCRTEGAALAGGVGWRGTSLVLIMVFTPTSLLILPPLPPPPAVSADSWLHGGVKLVHRVSFDRNPNENFCLSLIVPTLTGQGWPALTSVSECTSVR